MAEKKRIVLRVFYRSLSVSIFYLINYNPIYHLNYPKKIFLFCFVLLRNNIILCLLVVGTS